MMEKDKNMEYTTIKTAHGTFTTTINEMYKSRKKWERANEKHILSFIPGTITKLMVSEGDIVKKGDSLMLFTAMKMDNNVKSPIDGTIKKIYHNQGERLPKGELILEFE